MRRYHAMLLAISTVLSTTALMPTRPIPPPSDAPRSTVQTIAGDGRFGVPLGKALQSHFVLPVGVSVMHDQSILVVDAGMDAIYRLHDGIVTLVAGMQEDVRDSEGAVGGFRDGPAKIAVFDRPEAAMELPDRSIVIADSGNHCLRLLKDGVVTTLAGSLQAGSADGDRATATFNTPNSLAFDDGAIIVGDYNVGIRRVTLDGKVTTLPFGTTTVVGVAAQRIDGHQTIAYTENESVHIVTDGKDNSIKFSQDRMPKDEGVPVGRAWGIALLNENTVVVSDALTGVIRLIRFPSLPYTDQVASVALSGTLHEDTDFHGGFRDGSNIDALYHAPRGIALDAAGRLIIADSGNRRIRLLSKIDARETVLPDFSNYDAPAKDYNVVIIGPSLMFMGVMYGDSIPATAQDVFEAHAATDGIDRPVHVQAVRIDAAAPETEFSVANEFLVDRGNVRAVVFVVFTGRDPSPASVLAESQKLREAGVATIVYIGLQVQAFGVGEFPLNHCGCVASHESIERERARDRDIEAGYRKAGIQTESWLDTILPIEMQPDPPALLDTGNNHYTPAAQRFFGAALAQALLKDRRWLK